LAPLFARLWVADSYGAAVRSGFVFAVAWFFIDCIWVFRVFDAYGWVLIWLPIFWITLFGLLAYHVKRAGHSPWWSWPILWIAIEYVRSEFSPIRLDLLSDSLDPLRFSWLVLGHSRLSVPLLAQTADIWGGYGLSLAPLLTNLALADAIVHRRIVWRGAGMAAFLVAVELGYGTWAIDRTPAGDPIAVGVVQSERESLTGLLELTESLVREAPQVRIVVWPEESFSEKLGDLSIVQAFASQHNLVMAIGAEYLPDDGHHQNRAYLILPSGEVGIYHKRERVPFVETHTSQTDAPTFPITVDGRAIRAGVLICYDADFPTTARLLARGGAELLLMPTLDEGGWGGTQHVQHALLPRLRAIENRRPVVQAATSGVSQIIDDRGRVLAEIPYRLNRRPNRLSLFHEGAVHASIVSNAQLSLYTMGGYWFGPIVAVTGAGAILIAFRSARKSIV
jgi:apolipoprotein N-acyltransferase